MADRSQGGKRGARWREIVENDVDVKRWHDQLALGSRENARNYVTALNWFLRTHARGITPKAYIKLPAAERENLLIEAINRMAKEARPGYIPNTKKAVSSWLAFNRKPLSVAVKIPRAITRGIRQRYIPDQDQLRRVLDAGDLRDKVAISLVAMSGLRIGMLGNPDGTDGLRVGDIAEAKLGEGGMKFTTLPARLNIRAELSKTQKPSFTFVGSQTAEYIDGYLMERANAGEKIAPSSPLVVAHKFHSGALSSKNVSQFMRKPMRAAAVALDPYIWRSYFSSRTMLCRDAPREWVEFWMNHKGGVAEAYSLRKTLNPDVVESMRGAYGKCLPFIETSRRESEDPTLKVAAFLLLAAGYAQGDIDKMELPGKSMEEIAALIREAKPQFAADGGNLGPRQKAIGAADLDSALMGGWAWKANLPDGRVLIEAPTRP